LIYESRVGPHGDQLLQRTVDQPDLAQPQRVEARRVLGAEFAPAAAHRLPRVFGSGAETEVETSLRAAIVRMCSVPNNSMQPGCTPARTTIGAPEPSAHASGR
jgi:hypothetical protein